jgi:hypothetical protein
MPRSSAQFLSAVALVLLMPGCRTPIPPDTVLTPDGPWRIEMKTEGGLTGGGVGDLVVRSSGSYALRRGSESCEGELSGAELQSLRSAVVDALAVPWKEGYVRTENPYGYADQVRYELTVTYGAGGERRRSSYWFDETADRIPLPLRELASLAAEVRRERSRLCSPWR